MSDVSGRTTGPSCEGSISLDIRGAESLTPPVIIREAVIGMSACAPCGEIIFAPEQRNGNQNLEDIVSATYLQHCVKRQKEISAAQSLFPWLKPGESGDEQLESWKLARDLVTNQQETLGVVAGTLWLAKNNGGLDMSPMPSTDALKKLPANNARGRRIHVIFDQHGLVAIQQNPSGSGWYFQIKDHPAWLELAMIPQVQSLVADLSIREEYRQFNTYESYMDLVASVRRDLPQ